MMSSRVKFYTIRICLPLFLLLFTPAVFSQATKSWKLDVKGNVKDDDSKEAMKGAKIEVFKGGALIKTLYSDDKGTFSYSLDPDNNYTVKVSLGSYVSKIITISTENTPTDEEVKQNFTANTEFRIFKRVPDIDYSVLDSPIGSIFFDAAENKFDFNVVDFDIKKKLEELKKAIEQKKADAEAKEKAEKEAALKKAAFTKDSLAKADADAKKKVLDDAEAAKKKAAADAKAESDAKKKALADAEAAKLEEKKKVLADAEAAKAEAKKKAEQEELDKENAKKKAAQDEIDKANAKKKAEEDALASAAAKKKADQEELAKAAAAKKQAEEEEKAKLAAKKKADEEARKKPVVKPVAAAVVPQKAPEPVRHAPPEKPIESAPPEIIIPENVRYDEFDYGTYHVNRTFITTGGVEYEFQKIHHQWGGIFYKRDGLDITDGTYKKEMRKYGLKDL